MSSFQLFSQNTISIFLKKVMVVSVTMRRAVKHIYSTRYASQKRIVDRTTEIDKTHQKVLHVTKGIFDFWPIQKVEIPLTCAFIIIQCCCNFQLEISKLLKYSFYYFIKYFDIANDFLRMWCDSLMGDSTTTIQCPACVYIYIYIHIRENRILILVVCLNLRLVHGFLVL